MPPGISRQIYRQIAAEYNNKVPRRVFFCFCFFCALLFGEKQPIVIILLLQSSGDWSKVRKRKRKRNEKKKQVVIRKRDRRWHDTEQLY